MSGVVELWNGETLIASRKYEEKRARIIFMDRCYKKYKMNGNCFFLIKLRSRCKTRYLYKKKMVFSSLTEVAFYLKMNFNTFYSRYKRGKLPELVKI